ncbi:hypothetical protein E3O46_15615, partial [Cryobacterium glucosi]
GSPAADPRGATRAPARPARAAPALAAPALAAPALAAPALAAPARVHFWPSNSRFKGQKCTLAGPEACDTWYRCGATRPARTAAVDPRQATGQARTTAP